MNQSTNNLTIYFWLFCVSAHLSLLALATLTPIFIDTPLEGFGITVLIIPYLFQLLGLPTLEYGGLSSGGLPTPNLFGWLLSTATWLGFYWLLANGIKFLTRQTRGRRD
jgi:hypothetical protein